MKRLPRQEATRKRRLSVLTGAVAVALVAVVAGVAYLQVTAPTSPCGKGTSTFASGANSSSGYVDTSLKGKLTYNGTNNFLELDLAITNGGTSPVTEQRWQLLLLNETLQDNGTNDIGRTVNDNLTATIQPGETFCYPGFSFNWKAVVGATPEKACDVLTLLEVYQTVPTVSEGSHYYGFQVC